MALELPRSLRSNPTRMPTPTKPTASPTRRLTGIVSPFRKIAAITITKSGTARLITEARTEARAGDFGPRGQGRIDGRQRLGERDQPEWHRDVDRPHHREVAVGPQVAR